LTDDDALKKPGSKKWKDETDNSEVMGEKMIAECGMEEGGKRIATWFSNPQSAICNQVVLPPFACHS